MRRRPAPLAVALLAMAVLGVAGCTGSAGQSLPGSSRPTAVVHTPEHDHGQATKQSPAVGPIAGVLDMRIDELAPTDVVFQWKPGNILLQAGKTVTLKVANNDYMQHNLVFKAAKVNQNLPVGKVTTIKFTAPKAGTYDFWCKYHLQMMKGTVTVR